MRLNDTTSTKRIRISALTVRRAGVLVLAPFLTLLAQGQGLGIVVRVLPTCSIRTAPGREGLSCGPEVAPDVRLITGGGAQAYAGPSLADAMQVARTTKQVGATTYVVLDF